VVAIASRRASGRPHHFWQTRLETGTKTRAWSPTQMFLLLLRGAASLTSRTLLPAIRAGARNSHGV